MRMARTPGDVDIVPGAHLDPLGRLAAQSQDLFGARKHEEDLGGIMAVQGNGNARRDHSSHHAEVDVRGCGRGQELDRRSQDIEDDPGRPFGHAMDDFAGARQRVH